MQIMEARKKVTKSENQVGARVARHTCLIAMSEQDALNSAGVGFGDVIGHPVLPQQFARHFDHDVIRLCVRIAVEARQTLQARWAGGKEFDVAGKSICAQGGGALLDDLLFAEPYLRRDVGAGDREGAGFAAAAL